MERLRLVAFHLLVLAVLGSTQGLLMTQAAFSLRRDYIAERLCVNRDRPELDCHGQCYASLKAQQERERQQERQTLLLEVALSVTMLRPEGAALPPAPVRAAPAWAARPEASPAEGVRADVFHPPRVGRAAAEAFSTPPPPVFAAPRVVAGFRLSRPFPGAPVVGAPRGGRRSPVRHGYPFPPLRGLRRPPRPRRLRGHRPHRGHRAARARDRAPRRRRGLHPVPGLHRQRPRDDVRAGPALRLQRPARPRGRHGAPDHGRGPHHRPRRRGEPDAAHRQRGRPLRGAGRRPVRGALGEVPAGHYHGLRFDVGLAGRTNHVQITEVPAGHPLATQGVGNYWGWNAGYIFLRTEGRVDGDGDGDVDGAEDFDWNVHLGTDGYLMAVDVEEEFEVAAGGAPALHVQFDLAHLMEDVDLGDPAQRICHTTNNVPVADAVRGHAPDAFHFHGVHAD